MEGVLKFELTTENIESSAMEIANGMRGMNSATIICFKRYKRTTKFAGKRRHGR
jgi:hypothetical protein